MNEDKIREKGVLLSCNRVDRNVIRETWLYKATKVDIRVYDPSPYEIKELLSSTLISKSSMNKRKFDETMNGLCILRKRHKRIRKKGECRKKERGLTTTKLVDRYIKKRLAKKKRKK